MRMPTVDSVVETERSQELAENAAFLHGPLRAGRESSDCRQLD